MWLKHTMSIAQQLILIYNTTLHKIKSTVATVALNVANVRAIIYNRHQHATRADFPLWLCETVWPFWKCLYISSKGLLVLEIVLSLKYESFAPKSRLFPRLDTPKCVVLSALNGRTKYVFGFEIELVWD